MGRCCRSVGGRRQASAPGTRVSSALEPGPSRREGRDASASVAVSAGSANAEGRSVRKGWYTGEGRLGVAGAGAPPSMTPSESSTMLRAGGRDAGHPPRERVFRESFHTGSPVGVDRGSRRARARTSARGEPRACRRCEARGTRASTSVGARARARLFLPRAVPPNDDVSKTRARPQIFLLRRSRLARTAAMTLATWREREPAVASSPAPKHTPRRPNALPAPPRRVRRSSSRAAA